MAYPSCAAADCSDAQLNLMSLVRPDERAAKGVGGFSAMLRALRDSGLPVTFLPGVIHLPTVPSHRKLNRIDLGTADKLCVAALALAQHNRDEPALVVEFGSAFTAMMVLKNKQIVDGLGGDVRFDGREIWRGVGRRNRLPALTASEVGRVPRWRGRRARPRSGPHRVPRIVL